MNLIKAHVIAVTDSIKFYAALILYSFLAVIIIGIITLALYVVGLIVIYCIQYLNGTGLFEHKTIIIYSLVSVFGLIFLARGIINIHKYAKFIKAQHDDRELMKKNSLR